MSKIPHAWVEASLEARLTAHLHAWEKAKHAGQPLAPETFPFVTISREFGCEAIPLALRLAEILNERCRPFFTWVAYDRALLEKVAAATDLQRGVVESIDSRRREVMTQFYDSVLNPGLPQTASYRKLAEVVRSLAIHGHTILVGRGSHLITQDLKTGMHLRLVASRDWRVQKVASDRGLSHVDAQNIVDQQAGERDQFLTTTFRTDPNEPFNFDLLIDNSRFNLDQLAEIVFTALSARFGPTLVGA